jgi:hypothetical protein
LNIALKKINRIFGLLVAFSFLFLPNANGQEAITKLRVVTEIANVRLTPNIGSVIIHQVPQGTSLESTSKEGEWYLVKIQIEEGQEASGYVHESTVIVTERPPQKPTVTPVKKEEVIEPVKKEEITEPEKKEEEPQIQPIPETPSERQPFKSRLELWFLGGGNYAVGGDLNRGAQGFVDFYRDFHSIGEEFEAKPVHLSYLYGGEFSIPVGSNFYLGLGADFYHGERESLLELQGTPAIELRTHPKIQAVPIRLFISYYPVRSFYIKTGIEYYFAKCEYFYRYQEDTYWMEWRGTAKTQGSGILGAIGVDLEMAPWVSFNIEATGRLAKISGFKGSDRSIDSDGVEHIENGTLYFFKGKGNAEEPFPFLFIRIKEPIEDVLISDPRRAIIDFSGVSLKAGFKLRF